MKKYRPDNWLDKLIHDENLSDESTYAIYLFLKNLLMHFEISALHKLKRYMQVQEEANKHQHEYQNNDDVPF